MLQVAVSQDSGRPRSRELNVVISLLDINDNSPVFLRDKYSFAIKNTMKPAAVINKVSYTHHSFKHGFQDPSLITPIRLLVSELQLHTFDWSHSNQDSIGSSWYRGAI